MGDWCQGQANKVLQAAGCVVPLDAFRVWWPVEVATQSIGTDLRQVVIALEQHPSNRQVTKEKTHDLADSREGVYPQLLSESIPTCKLGKPLLSVLDALG